MRVTREEIFGPVMSVLTFDDEQDATERANSSEFGLGAGVMTADLSRAHRVADALISGNVWVNSCNILPPGLPFGGPNIPALDGKIRSIRWMPIARSNRFTSRCSPMPQHRP